MFISEYFPEEDPLTPISLTNKPNMITLLYNYIFMGIFMRLYFYASFVVIFVNTNYPPLGPSPLKHSSEYEPACRLGWIMLINKCIKLLITILHKAHSSLQCRCICSNKSEEF